MDLMNRTIFIVLVVFVGSFVLQFYLSGAKSPWPGIVLPGIFFTYAAVMALNATELAAAAAAFLLCNLPTFIHLAIYFSRRQRVKARREEELKRMDIADLE